MPTPGGRITPTRDSCFCQWQSLGHSAHIGQEVEVFYRWHPLFRRRVRRQYSERWATGEVVHVQVAPCIVIVVAAWMLDAVACAHMELGAPRASVEALADLHLLLSQQGLRRCFSGVSQPCEARHDPCTQTASTSDDIGTTNITSPASTEYRIRVAGAPRPGSERTKQCGHATGSHPDASSWHSSHDATGISGHDTGIFSRPPLCGLGSPKTGTRKPLFRAVRSIEESHALLP